MKNRYRHRCYRRPRTQAERKANQGDYVRAKRRPCNIPNSWDDYPVCVQKTWKVKRLKQYRDKPRGKAHEIKLDADTKWYALWKLKEYFMDHDIPFVVIRKNINEHYQMRIVDDLLA